jgi:hypothetical protein
MLLSIGWDYCGMPSEKASAPAAPAAASLSGKATEEFTALKHSLIEIVSWEISPNSWDKIQIIYPTPADEKQARSFLASRQLPSPEM